MWKNTYTMMSCHISKINPIYKVYILRHIYRWEKDKEKQWDGTEGKLRMVDKRALGKIFSKLWEVLKFKNWVISL